MHIGNVARGVPIDRSGAFSMAFFTDFNVRGYVGLLDWYTVSVAACAVVLLGAHGATYLTLKTEGPVHNRSAVLGRRLWIAAIPLLIIVSVETLFVRPHLVREGLAKPVFWLGMIVVVASVRTLVSRTGRYDEMRAFIGSNFLIMGMLATGGATIYPVMLLSTVSPEYSLRAEQAASSSSTLASALIWWPVAFVMAASYFVFISRRYSGKVSVKRDTQGYY